MIVPDSQPGKSGVRTSATRRKSRAEQQAEVREVAARALQRAGQLPQLRRAQRSVVVLELRGGVGHPPLEPPALRLQRERVRIPGGERVLDPREGWGARPVSRGVQESADLGLDHRRKGTA